MKAPVPLQVLLEKDPAVVRLMELLSDLEVPTQLLPFIRRQGGIVCAPNDCCVTEVLSALSRGAELMQRCHKQIGGKYHESLDPYVVLMLTAEGVEPGPIRLLRDERESQCEELCGLPMPSGLGWEELIKPVTERAVQQMGGRKWLYSVVTPEIPGNGHHHLLSLAPFEVNPTSGARTVCGESLHLSARDLYRMPWQDLQDRFEKMALSVASYQLFAYMMARIEDVSDRKLLLPLFHRLLDKGFKMTDQDETVPSFVGKVKMGPMLEELYSIVRWETGWAAWTQFYLEMQVARRHTTQ